MNNFALREESIPPKLQIDLIKETLFRQPLHKHFVLQNFPLNVNDFATFERELFPMDYLLTFKRQDHPIPYA